MISKISKLKLESVNSTDLIFSGNSVEFVKLVELEDSSGSVSLVKFVE